MWNPNYFNYGIAIHGALNVPLYPASHGCIRIPLNISEDLQDLVSVGDQVYVWDGVKEPESYGAQPPTVQLDRPELRDDDDVEHDDDQRAVVDHHAGDDTGEHCAAPDLAAGDDDDRAATDDHDDHHDHHDRPRRRLGGRTRRRLSVARPPAGARPGSGASVLLRGRRCVVW